ncbi:MAG: hypothetical protein CL441_02270, partial [Acidimicrobiaceae bacterium]|nr:hypothetical protein [Acidimicrobiaceae bacterium]
MIRRGAVAVALVLVLVACGGGADDEGPVDSGGVPTTSEAAVGTTAPGAPGEGSTRTDSTPEDTVSPAPSTTEDVVTSPTVATEFGNPYSRVDGSTTTTTEAPWDGLT